MEGTRVLVVDDEEEFAVTLAERLELRGFEVKVAPDGETALEMAQTEAPDVMVLDLKLPGLDGFGVLGRVRADMPGLPVILLTGQGSTREGMEGMRLGAYDFMVKPLDIETLVAKINQAVGEAGCRGREVSDGS
jgi:DNA-binding response OmpR family regulator